MGPSLFCFHLPLRASGIFLKILSLYYATFIATLLQHTNDKYATVFSNFIIPISRRKLHRLPVLSPASSKPAFFFFFFFIVAIAHSL